MKPSLYASNEYWKPVGTKKSGTGGWAIDQAPISTIMVWLSGPSTRYMPTMSCSPRSDPTPVTSAYAVAPRKTTSTTPAPMKNGSGLRFGNPVVKSVKSPVFGFTRQMEPSSGAVTYKSLPGPTVLPWSSTKPVTSGFAGPDIKGGLPPLAKSVTGAVPGTTGGTSPFLQPEK